MENVARRETHPRRSHAQSLRTSGRISGTRFGNSPSPRRGHKKARGAVKHTVITAIWHMLSAGETYRDLGGDDFTRRDLERETKRLIA